MRQNDSRSDIQRVNAIGAAVAFAFEKERGTPPPPSAGDDSDRTSGDSVFTELEKNQENEPKRPSTEAFSREEVRSLASSASV